MRLKRDRGVTAADGNASVSLVAVQPSGGRPTDVSHRVGHAGRNEHLIADGRSESPSLHRKLDLPRR